MSKTNELAASMLEQVLEAAEKMELEEQVELFRGIYVGMMCSFRTQHVELTKEQILTLTGGMVEDS